MTRRKRLTYGQRSEILARQNFTCVGKDCGKRVGAGDPVEYDHVVPLALGGKDAPDNIQAMCPACHKIKTVGRFLRERLSSDIFNIAKAKRIARGGKTKRGPKMRSRGFDKRFRKRMSGKVVSR